MTKPNADNPVNPMLIELAASRLALLAIAAHLIASSTNSAATIKAMQTAIDGTAGSSVTMGDMTPEVHTAATALVRKRATAFFVGFHRL